MSRPRTTPTCSFRITVRRLRLLLPGLQELVVGMANVAAKNQARLALPAPKCNTGAFSKNQSDALLRIRNRIMSTLVQPPACDKVRLHLDCFGVAACQLAARLSRRLAPRKAGRGAITSLLKQLEGWRRRAARLYIRTAGPRSFAQASYRWRQFVRWVRSQALWKIPKCYLDPRALDNGRRYMPKQDHRNVQLAMGQARRELTNRGEQVPPEKELRNLVRQAFRKVRRSKRNRQVSIIDMTSTKKGAQFLGEFILRKTGVIKV